MNQDCFRYDAAYRDFTCGVYLLQKEFIYLIKNPFSKLMLLLIVGTVPAVVIGLLFKDFFEDISKTGITIGWEFW